MFTFRERNFTFAPIEGNAVLSQSGSAMADWALIQDRWRAENTSKVFAKSLGCNIETSWKIVDCLKRGRSHLELGNVNFKVCFCRLISCEKIRSTCFRNFLFSSQPDIGLLPWGPVLDVNFTVPTDDSYQGWSHSDWYFANETVEASINSRRFNRNLVYMSGVTTQEAAYFLCESDRTRSKIT